MRNFCINLSSWNDYDSWFFSFLKNICLWNFKFDSWITNHESLIQMLVWSESELWQQLTLIYETLWIGTGSSMLISVLANQFVLFNWSNTTVATDVKMDESVLEEKSSFKMLGLSFLSKLEWALTLSLLPKLPPRKYEP